MPAPHMEQVALPGKLMRKLNAVEEARAVMKEGAGWSAWKWMLEKHGVREIADRATAALARANQRAKSAWPKELKAAYEACENGSKSKTGSSEQEALSPELMLSAKRVKKADDRAARATLEAEQMFDEAERAFSADMARQAARKALESNDLRESAIRETEAATAEHEAVSSE